MSDIMGDLQRIGDGDDGGSHRLTDKDRDPEMAVNILDGSMQKDWLEITRGIRKHRKASKAKTALMRVLLWGLACALTILVFLGWLRFVEDATAWASQQWSFWDGWVWLVLIFSVLLVFGFLASLVLVIWLGRMFNSWWDQRKDAGGRLWADRERAWWSRLDTRLAEMGIGRLQIREIWSGVNAKLVSTGENVRPQQYDDGSVWLLDTKDRPVTPPWTAVW